MPASRIRKTKDSRKSATASSSPTAIRKCSRPSSTPWSPKSGAERQALLLVLDNASWHKTNRLGRHHIEPVYLTPYSPDIIPIERRRQHLNSHYMAGFITKEGLGLDERILQSIRTLLRAPQNIRSVCRTHSE